MNFIIGIIMIAVGFLLVLKSEWLLENFGRISFFEDHMGTEGGSRLGYKLIGLAVIFIGVLVLTNMIGGFLEWVFAPLLRYSRQLG